MSNVAAINAGLGQQYAEEQSRLLLPFWATVAPKRVKSYGLLIPESYRRCHTFSDFWSAYEKVFDQETHRSVGKERGETAYMKRWNITPYASALLGMSAKRSRFPSVTFGIRL